MESSAQAFDEILEASKNFDRHKTRCCAAQVLQRNVGAFTSGDAPGGPMEYCKVLSSHVPQAWMAWRLPKDSGVLEKKRQSKSVVRSAVHGKRTFLEGGNLPGMQKSCHILSTTNSQDLGFEGVSRFSSR